jgi:hypothetical protein
VSHLLPDRVITRSWPTSRAFALGMKLVQLELEGRAGRKKKWATRGNEPQNRMAARTPGIPTTIEGRASRRPGWNLCPCGRDAELKWIYARS